jgi:hypothetical protein
VGEEQENEQQKTFTTLEVAKLCGDIPTHEVINSFKGLKVFTSRDRSGSRIYLQKHVNLMQNIRKIKENLTATIANKTGKKAEKVMITYDMVETALREIYPNFDEEFRAKLESDVALFDDTSFSANQPSEFIEMIQQISSTMLEMKSELQAVRQENKALHENVQAINNQIIDATEPLKKEIDQLRKQGEERDIKLVTDMRTLIKNRTEEKQMLEELVIDKREKRISLIKRIFGIKDND